MAHVLIDGYPVLTFEYAGFKEKHWDSGLSPYIIDKYGEIKNTTHVDVENIFYASFEYMIQQFEILVQAQHSELFFHGAFLLHEASIDLYIKQLKGYELPTSIKDDFPRYRRALKLILEQGCEIEITAKTSLSHETIINTLQELYYISTWIYEFAENIAIMKMIPGSHFIDFEDGVFTYGWQHSYGILYHNLMKEFSLDYEAFFDEHSIDELKEALESNFEIDYDKALGLILTLKRHFSPCENQTIEPYVLPINLAHECRTSEDNTKAFYAGLTISKHNKLSIKDAILKPHSVNRYMYRPILVYNVDGIERALIGENKIAESMMVLSTNATHWNTMQNEWAINKGMEKFRNQKGQEHDKLLENKIEELFKNIKYPYCRNIKSFKQNGKKANVKIDIEGIGEIDFIIVNSDKRKIYIADTKYNKARYEAVGFRMDYSSFLSYEPKLYNKFNWLTQHLQVLQEHLEFMFNIDYSILDFETEAVFFINTPTFYMFNGKYKAITFNRIQNFVEETWNFPAVEIADPKNYLKFSFNHPYFKTQPIIQHD